MNHSFVLQGGPGLTPDAPKPPINLPGNLRERALLVSLKIKSWGATRKDKVATEAAQQATGAQRGTGAYQKQLVPTAALREIKKVDGEIRAYLAENSLPWDDGKVLVPSVVFEQTMAGVRTRVAARDIKVQAFVAAYPTLIQEAQQALGSLFDETQYPAPETIEKEFSVLTEFEPVPAGADFRCDLPIEAVESIRTEIKAGVQRHFAEAHSALWERLREAVEAMAERLSKKPGEPGAIFHDSLVTNLRELCDILPGLNVAEDAGLTAMLAEVKAKLTLTSPDELRTSRYARGLAAAQAEDIAKRIP